MKKKNSDARVEDFPMDVRTKDTISDVIKMIWLVDDRQKTNTKKR